MFPFPAVFEIVIFNKKVLRFHLRQVFAEKPFFESFVFAYFTSLYNFYYQTEAGFFCKICVNFQMFLLQIYLCYRHKSYTFQGNSLNFLNSVHCSRNAEEKGAITSLFGELVKFVR